MEHFVRIVNGWKPLAIITKSSILDVAAVLGPPLKLQDPQCHVEVNGSISDNFLVQTVLTLGAPNPQNGQTHSNNFSATADKLFECV